MNQDNSQQDQMDQDNPQQDQMEPQWTHMDPSAALSMILNELNILRNQVSSQDERLRQITLRVEDLSRPGPTTTSAPNPAPLTPQTIPTQPTKSERLPDPEKFTGKRNELRPFLAQLKNKLEGNADRYPTEQERLRYALSRVAGDAAITIEPFAPTTVAALVETLEASYGDPNRQATAQQRINRMTQGDLSFPVYFARFHQYSKQTGWNDAAQINHLVESLNPELKRTLIGVTLPARLEDCANLINRHWNDLLRLQSRTSYRTGNPMAASSPTRPSTQVRKKDPEAMDLDIGTQGYAPKNSAERQKRAREGRCFKCGSKTHLSPACSVPIPRASPAIAGSRPPSPTVSLKELPQE